jgi:hypothetical protein
LGTADRDPRQRAARRLEELLRDELAPERQPDVVGDPEEDLVGRTRLGRRIALIPEGEEELESGSRAHALRPERDVIDRELAAAHAPDAVVHRPHRLLEHVAHRGLHELLLLGAERGARRGREGDPTALEPTLISASVLPCIRQRDGVVNRRVPWGNSGAGVLPIDFGTRRTARSTRRACRRPSGTY